MQDQEGLTPLHWAVMCDQTVHIQQLLTRTDADVRIQDKEGRTPLNYAVLNFSPSCIKVKEPQKAYQGYNPLNWRHNKIIWIYLSIGLVLACKIQ